MATHWDRLELAGRGVTHFMRERNPGAASSPESVDFTAKLLAEKSNPQADVVMGVAASSLALLDGPAARPSFVPGIGRWLGWADAIPLSTALHSPSHGAAASARRDVSASQCEREFERVRAALVQSIEAGADGYLLKGTEPAEAAAALLWAVVNSAEFLTNR